MKHENIRERERFGLEKAEKLMKKTRRGEGKGQFP